MSEKNKILHPDFKIICIYTGDVLEQDIPQEELQEALLRAIEKQKERGLFKDRPNFSVRAQ